MLLSEVNYMRWLVHRLAEVVDVEVLALVNHKELTHSAHEPAVVGVQRGATSFRIEVKPAPFQLDHCVLASLVPNRNRSREIIVEQSKE